MEADLPVSPDGMRIGPTLHEGVESQEALHEGLGGSGPGAKDALNALPSDSGVCASRPAAQPSIPEAPKHEALPAPSGPRLIGPDDQVVDLAKREGMPHPLFPRTPNQIAEFAALWHNPEVSIGQMARRYRCSDRTIQTWRKRFKLEERRAGRHAARDASTIAGAAGEIVKEVRDAVNTGSRILQAQAALGVELGIKAAQNQEAVASGKMVPWHGRMVDPEVMARACDPLKNEEVRSLLSEVQAEARLITQHSDLTALQRKLAKITILTATQMPVYTWESLQSVLDALSRAVLWTRKVEADIPQTGADPVLLRQEAGRQMMKELRQALSPEDQQALSVLVKRGADKIMADKGVVKAEAVKSAHPRVGGGPQGQAAAKSTSPIVGGVGQRGPLGGQKSTSPTVGPVEGAGGAQTL